MFEIDDDGNLASAHHPFTSPTEDTIKFLDNEPLKVRARSYDLVLNGFELSSGSIRIIDKDLQTKMFEILKLSQKEIEEKFGFFINAFQYGVPPHGGLAFGIDRLIMILANETSIREVIAFPKNANGIDVMLNSPSSVAMIGYLAFISAAAYTLWATLLKYNPVSKVSVYGFINPVIGVILSSVLLKEDKQPSLVTAIIALALVCVGIYVVNREKK